MTTSAAPARRRTTRDWIPRQHGAWAMLVAPFWVGAILGARLGTFPLADLALFAFWMCGYLAFHAIGQWLKSGRKPRYRAPALWYSGITGVLGLLTLGLLPGLVVFIPAFLPLLAVGLWSTARRRERSLLSGFVTVAAACLMTPVTYAAAFLDDGFLGFSPEVTTDLRRLVIVTVALLVYFFGTVLYVKTIIRERENASYRVASIVYHLVALTAAIVVTLVDSMSWWLVAVFAALAVRAAALAGRRVRPAFVGAGEIVATLAVVAACLTVPAGIG